MSDDAGIAAEVERVLTDDRCPEWCTGGHMQAYLEGATVEEARRHIGPDLSGYMPEMRGAGGALERHGGGVYVLDLEARPPLRSASWGLQLIQLRAIEPNPDRSAMVELTSGEARVLARQLVAFADRIDL